MAETTEAKFKKWCNKHFDSNQKLCTHTKTGKGIKQVSDFLCTRKGKTYFVEVKEVEKSNYFPFSRWTQKKKMIKRQKDDKCVKIFIIVYFKKYDVVNVFTLDELLYLEDTITFNNGKKKEGYNIKDISSELNKSWKELSL